MRIKKAIYIVSSPDHEKCPVPDKAEYAFIGRSNVGKSSLINMICDNDKLAKTSGSPGKTQLINHFEIVSSVDESEGKKKIDYAYYGTGEEMFKEEFDKLYSSKALQERLNKLLKELNNATSIITQKPFITKNEFDFSNVPSRLTTSGTSASV